MSELVENILEMRSITKVFPGVRALDHVSFSVRNNSVHALIGENGAGKSTLMKILSGQYSEYEGEIFIEGQPKQFNNEKMALDAGIAIVSQELNLVHELTVADNIFLGREIKHRGVLLKKEQNRRTEALLKDMKLNFHATDRIGELSIAQRQLVEIVKATSRDAKIVVMDEPTSALTDIEVEVLFELIRKLKTQGITIIYISHKLDEVFEICDRATVLRDGKHIGDVELSGVSQSTLITMMVGREVGDFYPDMFVTHEKDVVLEVKNLYRKGEFENVSFQLHKGEILGVAGMMGAGRSEVAKAIFGLTVPDAGSILVNGKPAAHHHTKDAIKNGIAMVTEDRAAYGFVGMLSIRDNILLSNCDQFSNKMIIDRRASGAAADKLIHQLSIKANSADTVVGTLSGGNQQKVILAKWLARNIKILILDEPTRGIDVGAKQEIYRLIAELAQQGMSILMISSELPEIMGMSHRTLIMAGGKIRGELSHEEITQERIMSIILSGEEHRDGDEK